MKAYNKVDVSESTLEHLVQQHAELIEDGLCYVDHQKRTSSGRLDVLLVDSGHAMVVAELKVVQDDGMLMQGVDYYDYVISHIDSFARLYKHSNIKPTQQVRLLLLAPSFSQALINRCKWLDIPVSLVTFQCLQFDGEKDIVPIFAEQQIPKSAPLPELVTIDDHLNYITDQSVRVRVLEFLDEIRSWDSGNITVDAIKYALSIKVNNRVFGNLYTRRKHFVMATYNFEDEWNDYAVKDDEDLESVRATLRQAMERKAS